MWSEEHGAVAKTAFSSENAQNTILGALFEVLKIAGGCGEKHIHKRKCEKTEGLRALFEVLMSKNCTQLWRKARFEVKMHKTPDFWNPF